MSKGDGLAPGKHDEKMQTHWFKLIAQAVLVEDESGVWAEWDADDLAPLIRRHIAKYILHCFLTK
jgi:hypothetical protein